MHYREDGWMDGSNKWGNGGMHALWMDGRMDAWTDGWMSNIFV